MCSHVFASSLGCRPIEGFVHWKEPTAVVSVHGYLANGPHRFATGCGNELHAGVCALHVHTVLASCVAAVNHFNAASHWSAVIPHKVALLDVVPHAHPCPRRSSHGCPREIRQRSQLSVSVCDSESCTGRRCFTSVSCDHVRLAGRLPLVAHMHFRHFRKACWAIPRRDDGRFRRLAGALWRRWRRCRQPVQADEVTLPGLRNWERCVHLTNNVLRH